MSANPAQNCVGGQVPLSAMLKSLSVARLEKQPRTVRSWVSSTTTVVKTSMRVTEEMNPAPLRKKS